jgi:hypothetical protein
MMWTILGRYAVLQEARLRLHKATQADVGRDCKESQGLLEEGCRWRVEVVKDKEEMKLKLARLLFDLHPRSDLIEKSHLALLRLPLPESISFFADRRTPATSTQGSKISRSRYF